jgi:hypothetical protein
VLAGMNNKMFNALAAAGIMTIECARQGREFNKLGSRSHDAD